MALTITGHAEIDKQHEILETIVARLHSFCPELERSPDADCRACLPARRKQCTAVLGAITGELVAFLVGHATYEERMMQLLPDTPTCQAHIRAHKAAHEGLSKRLNKLSGQVAHEAPRSASALTWKVISDWLGDHTALFDRRLVRLGRSASPEIDFDAELVGMLDQHVFPNRPTMTRPTAQADQTLQRRRLEMRGRVESLTPSQREVFWLVVGGRKNREIAAALGITVNTVKSHRRAVFQKMEVGSVVELLKKADVLR